MKLTKITIVNFGKFSNRTFDFTNPLTVIYGANEAGKSTLVAFIKQVLFGLTIKGNAKLRNDYHPKVMPDIFGGSLTFKEDVTDKTYKLSRFLETNNKSGRLTVEEDGTEVPDKVFFDQIKNIDETFFDDSFLYDQTTLAKILTLNEQELITQINYLGAANSADWLDLKNKLEKQADTQYKISVTAKKPLNQDLKQLDTLLAQKQDKESELEAFKANEEKLAPLDKELTELQTKFTALNEQQVKLAQQQKQAAIFAEYQQRKEQLLPNFVFNQTDYEAAVQNEATSKQLAQKVASLNEQLANSKQTDQFSAETAQKVILGWSDINLIHDHLVSDEQELSEHKSEQQRINNFQPEVVRVASFDEEEIAQLRNDLADVKAAREKQNAPAPKKETTLGPITIIGFVIAAFGMLGFILKLPAILNAVCLIGGVALSLWSLKGTGAKSTPTEDVASYRNLVAGFSQKYHFDPVANIADLLMPAEKYHELVKKIAVLEDKIEAEEHQIIQFKNDNLEVLKLTDANTNWSVVAQKVLGLQEQINQQTQLAQQQKIVAQDLEQALSNQKDYQQKSALLFAQNQVANLAEFKEKADQNREQTNLKNWLELQEKTLGKDLASFLNKELSAESIANQLQEVKIEQATLNEQINENRQLGSDLRSSQNLLANDTAVQELNQEISDLEAQILDQMDAWLVNKLGSSWISAMLNHASKDRFPKMEEAAQKYFGLLSGDRYPKLEITEKAVQVKNQANEVLTPEKLSRGTVEQLYFALKLAFVEQISPDVSLPVLIDDAFVNFDPERVQYMKELLDNLASTSQVILFTARPDIAELFGDSDDNLVRM